MRAKLKKQKISNQLPTTSEEVAEFLVIYVVSSTLFFLRYPGFSFSFFDLVFFYGLARFPSVFFGGGFFIWLFELIIVLCSIIATFLSGYDINGGELPQALIICFRYFQMLLTLNFLKNMGPFSLVQFKLLSTASLIAITLPIVIGIFLFFVDSQLVSFSDRYSSYLLNPGLLGAFIVISTPLFFCLSSIVFDSRPKRVIINLIMLCLFAISLVFSGSNSGIIGFIAMLLLLTILGNKKNIFNIAACVSVIILSGYFVPYSNIADYLISSEFFGLRISGKLLKALVNGFVLNEIGSYTFRAYVQNFLLNDYLSSVVKILFGMGPGQSPLIFSLYHNGSTITIHNMYLCILVEFGLIGTFALFSQFLISLYALRPNIRNLILFIGYLLAGFTTPALYLPFLWVPMLIVFALDCRKQRIIDV